MNRANNVTTQTTRRIESRFDAMNRRVEAGFVGLQRGIAAAFAGAAALRGATQLIDSATRIENALKVTGLAGEELEAVYQKLFESARNNAAPLEALVTLYGRAALVQNELGVSTEQLLGFTNNVALALRVSGQSAAEASGALLQLSQALGSGVVRAEEFNSILEGAPTILQAAAAGIAEAEGSVAKLRTIMLDGRLSSRALFDGFEAGSVILEQKVAGASLTVQQAFENLRTELIDLAKEMNEGTNVSEALANGIADLSMVIQDVGAFANAAVGPISNFVGWLQEMQGAAVGAANALAAITGLDRVGASAAGAINDLGIPGLEVGSSAGGNVVQGTFELLGATPQDEALAALLTGEAPAPERPQITVTAPPRTISVNDDQYRVSGAGSGGGSGGRGGGGGSASQNDYERQREQYQERLRQMEMEIQLQQRLNPLVNDYGFAMEQARAQMELENAAVEAGLTLSPQRRSEIEQLSTAYATATANAARLSEQQDLLVQTFDDLQSAGRSALESIVQGFIEGQSAGEIFQNVLSQLATSLLNIGLNSLFGGFGGIFGGGGLPGFATGTANTGGARGQVRGVVHGQEAVIPLPNGGRVPVQIQGGGQGGSPSPIPIEIFVSPTGEFDARVGSVVDRRATVIVTQSIKQNNKRMPALMADMQQRE